jgi:hypothetical protein
MMRQEVGRCCPDRRADTLTADLVEIGLLFIKVFGLDRGQGFFRCTIVEAHVYRRVLLGPRRRRRQQRGGAADLIPMS